MQRAFIAHLHTDSGNTKPQNTWIKSERIKCLRLLPKLVQILNQGFVCLFFKENKTKKDKTHAKPSPKLFFDASVSSSDHH